MASKIDPALVDALPTPDALDQALSVGLSDETGAQRPFEGLIRHGKIIVVFIRHFHCGMCQDYVQALGKTFSPSALSAQNIKMIIIGCGHWSVVRPYKDVLGVEFDFYADQTRKLYDTFGMIKHLTPGKQEDATYTGSVAENVKKSIINIWKMGLGKGLSGGNISQLGGEFIFQEGKPVWAHRMRTARDHTSPEVLADAAGFKVPS